MIGYYDINGKPIDFEQFARLKWDADGRVSNYAVIGRHSFGTGRGEVSTVWLGLDHSFMRHERPVIFETLIFGGDHDGMLRRYCTKCESLRGHREAVNNMARGRAPW